MSPISLFLRMLQRIAVTLGGGCKKETGLVLARRFQGIKSSRRAHLQGRDPVGHVIHRAGGRGQMINLIHAAEIKGLTDIEFQKLKT